jgi:hypothetical protein
VPNYIEDVFSTWLYTGNSTPLNITNGIDLAGKGGLVWTKERNNTASHLLIDSQRGLSGGFLRTNTTDAADTSRVSESINSFNTNGYTLHAPDTLWNRGSFNYVSWTFREQPKFFDVVTWSGDSVGGRQISHNLQSVPGCIIIKTTSTTSNWTVVHRSLPAWDYFLRLNTTDAADNAGGLTQAPTSTQFSATGYNDSGRTYVAYLFAHNAGGFGLTGTDNVISCGSYTGNGSTNGPVINLGYEPQWVMVKRASTGGGIWTIVDNMRGMPDGGSARVLIPNTADAEFADPVLKPLATGFQVTSDNGAYNGNGSTIIYIAIRRGPMKVPTTGTSVFTPVAQNSAGTVTTGFPVDLMLGASRNIAHNTYALDRLRGSSTTRFAQLRTDTTSAESSGTGVGIGLDNNAGYVDNWFIPSGSGAASGSATAYWNFRRAPGFFDVVCYTVSGFAANNVAHNLTVTPELFITKPRGSTGGWTVYGSVVGSTNNYMTLNADTALQTSGAAVWAATSTTFSDISTVANGTYVAYLFATCPGVSKVGSYTGNGGSQTINCGFTGGARFVLIKQTSGGGGDWFVFDTARGIGGSVDPWLALNRTLAEQNTDDAVDPASVGFIVNQSIDVNLNGETYIFLAIA